MERKWNTEDWEDKIQIFFVEDLITTGNKKPTRRCESLKTTSTYSKSNSWILRIDLHSAWISVQRISNSHRQESNHFRDCFLMGLQFQHIELMSNNRKVSSVTLWGNCSSYLHNVVVFQNVHLEEAVFARKAINLVKRQVKQILQNFRLSLRSFIEPRLKIEIITMRRVNKTEWGIRDHANWLTPTQEKLIRAHCIQTPRLGMHRFWTIRSEKRSVWLVDNQVRKLLVTLCCR